MLIRKASRDSQAIATYFTVSPAGYSVPPDAVCHPDAVRHPDAVCNPDAVSESPR